MHCDLSALKEFDRCDEGIACLREREGLQGKVGLTEGKEGHSG